MELICFAPVKAHLQRLTTTVFDKLPKADNVEVYQNIDEFFGRLHQPKLLDSIIIICIRNSNEFEVIMTNKNLFINTRIILVLPDRNKETLVNAHSINPRFLQFSNGNFNQIAEVVKKMRRNFYSND